jgi:glycosyltransferase involved in cell wall biosynthesis
MSPSTPLVSVIMPIKSCDPAFLEKSVRSLLAQTLMDMELLIVMDVAKQSLNKTLLNVLEKFENDGRLRLIPNKEKGFVEALNTGILSSRGKYIARLDGDDISLPNRLQLQIETIEKEKVDFVGGWAYVINEHGKIIGRLTPPTDAQKIKRLIMLHNPFLHSTVTFKKSILRHSGLYNSALFGAEDYELWLRIVSLGYNCINLNRFVSCVRESRNSIIRGSNWKKTRVNYAKAKALGFVKLGYHDPLSVFSCLVGPFSSVIDPRIASNLKSFLRWFEPDPLLDLKFDFEMLLG